MAKLSDEQLRDIFLANGFTVKEGQRDLKAYVYAAARAIEAAVLAALPCEPVAWMDKNEPLMSKAFVFADYHGQSPKHTVPLYAPLPCESQGSGTVAAESGSPQDDLSTRNTQLRKFLDAAAGEGFVLAGVDAADLFIEIFGEPT